MKISRNLDDTDSRILKILQRNGRAKNTEIARELDVTEGAIRKRIKRLVDTKVIERFTVQISPSLSGIRAIVEVKIGGSVRPTKIKELIFKSIGSGVEWLYEVTGPVDLFVVLHRDTEYEIKDAIEKIREIEGVEETRTHVVLTKQDSRTY